jgi:hypothetical protein
MDESIAEEAAPRSRWLATLGRWTARALVIAAFLALTPMVAGAAMLSPFLKDDVKLDRVVRAVALDWRDFGRAAAQSRLEYELDHQGIGLQVGDDDCALSEEEGIRRVSCRWQTAVELPGLAEPVALPFTSVAEISPEGELE